MQLNCDMAAESLLNRCWSTLDGSWSRLGALKIASKRPDGDRWEVGERSRGVDDSVPAPGEVWSAVGDDVVEDDGGIPIF